MELRDVVLPAVASRLFFLHRVGSFSLPVAAVAAVTVLWLGATILIVIVPYVRHVTYIGGSGKCVI